MSTPADLGTPSVEELEALVGLEADEQPADLEVEDDPPVPPLRTCLAGTLAALAPAWLVGGLFRGPEARAVGIAAVVLGGAVAYFSVRWARPWLQYLLLPLGLLLGAVLAAPGAHAGSSLPKLVQDALHTGGILQPPIDFAPGWKVILAVLLVMLAGGAAALGIAVGRPRLSAAVPVPVAFGAAIVQPPDAQVSGALVAAVLVVAALAVSYGADLSRDSGVGGSFERIRLLRTGALGVGLVLCVLGISQFGFLFPHATKSHVQPPTRPQLPPPTPDRPLFLVHTDQRVPLRLGVIDVYRDGAFMLPPFDQSRLQRLQAPASLTKGDPHEPPPPVPPTSTFTMDVTVQKADGHLAPVPAWATRLGDLNLPALYDPRSQTIRTASQPLFPGLHYTVTAGTPPTAKDMEGAGTPPSQVTQYLTAPPIPLDVRSVIDKAPANPFDKLQYVRKELYRHVVAAGSGKPVDVSGARVVAMLHGGEANPYEITAAEALLARWAGIPARIGYGYYGGTEKSRHTYELRPGNGATWLEAYFTGYGWQPIVGVPPQAKRSLSQANKNSNNNIVAINKFGLVLYLPTDLKNGLPLFVVARYYLVRALPIGLAATVLLLAYPGVVKALRRRRRRRWAAALGPQAGIAVAYAEFRDRARDLAVGEPMSTPLEFLDAMEPDDEHQELAWLVTRAMWGDYRRMLTPELAMDARVVANSVSSRLAKGQTGTTRLLAFMTRTSLRDPYSREVPNLWWRPRSRQARQPRSILGRLRSLRPAPGAASLVLVLAAMLTGGCQAHPHSPPGRAVPLPSRLVPSTYAGFVFHEEPKAESVYLKSAADADVIVQDARIFSLRSTSATEGAVQFGRFKPGYSSDDPHVVQAVQQKIGHFERLTTVGQTTIYTSTQPDQRLYLWFPAHANAMAVLGVLGSVGKPVSDALATAVVSYGLSEPLPRVPTVTPVPTAVPTPSTRGTS